MFHARACARAWENINFKYKFIFIKNYKTAGSSIETYIYNYLDKEIQIIHKEKKDLEQFAPFKKELY